MSSRYFHATSWFYVCLLALAIAVFSVSAVFLYQGFLFNGVLLLLTALGLVLLALYFHFQISSRLASFTALENWAYLSKICGEIQPMSNQNSNIVSQTVNSLLKEWDIAKDTDSSVDQHIRQQALIDAETGVGNREYFNNRLEALLKEEDIQGAVYFIQFNEGDAIYSLYGRQMTQQIFQQVIATLKRQLINIQGVYIARRSTFELALIVPGIYFTEAEKLAHRIIKSMSALSLPIGIEKDSFVHIGVSYFSEAENSYQIKSEADMALRSAQLQGPSQWFMYDPGEVEHVSAKGSLQWRTFLQKSLDQNSFVSFFQPVISSVDEQTLHHEVLAKVRDSDGGLISARVFVPMAVKCGLIKKIDLLVFEQVCRLLSYDNHLKDDCSLNFSIETLLAKDFLPELITILKKYKDITPQIIIEITEYHLANNLEVLKPILITMNQLGLRILTDKVGQYIENAEYLKYCPISFIKLHSSIVLNIHQRTENQIFIRSLSTICSQQNVAIYALGIERAEEWQTLIKLGVTGGQGHYFTEPITQVAKAIQLP